MIHRKKILHILLVLPLLIFMASEEESHSSALFDFMGKLVNFIILFGGIAFVLRKPIQKFLAARGQDIERSLKEASELKSESEKKLQAVKDRYEQLRDEIRKIGHDSEEEGLQERDLIIKAASQEAKRIEHFARQEIIALSQGGIRELRGYTAELAIALARERIQKRLTAKEHSRLIDKSIDRLEGLYEKTGSGKKIHPGIS